MSRSGRRILLLAALAAAAACAPGAGDWPDNIGSTAGLSFAEFRARTYREPETGIYIVDGDVPVLDDKQLAEVWAARGGQGLTVNVVNNARDVWDSLRKSQLTYCVSEAFGPRREQVLQTLEACTNNWEAAAGLTFVHLTGEDDSCDQYNENVVFDVRPASGQPYIARSFFPSAPRASRNLLFNDSAFNLHSTSYDLVGVCTHELGHVLGFRHEHIREEAGASSGCAEDGARETLTIYDRDSVMHYPQCNGNPQTSLTLTPSDIAGAQVVYGPPGSGPNPVPPGATLRLESRELSMKAGEVMTIGPIAAIDGTVFVASSTGSGDADLFVRAGAPATEGEFDCRPFLLGASEQCSVDVAGGEMHVRVAAKSGARITLNLQWYALDESPAPDPAGLGDTGSEGEDGGGCQLAAGGTATPSWALLVFVLPLMARRRRPYASPRPASAVRRRT